jgi:hypothetical protein
MEPEIHAELLEHAACREIAGETIGDSGSDTGPRPGTCPAVPTQPLHRVLVLVLVLDPV